MSIIAEWDWAEGWEQTPGIVHGSYVSGPVQERYHHDGDVWMRLQFEGRDGTATVPAHARYQFSPTPEVINPADRLGLDHVFFQYGFRWMADVPTSDGQLIGGKFPGFDGRWGAPRAANGGYWEPNGANGGVPAEGKFFPFGHRGETAPQMVGWSARGQWWANPAPDGHPLQDVVTLGSYLYHPPWRKLGTGDAREWNNVVFQPGEERHTVEQEWKVNTITGPYDDHGNGVGQPDGVIRAWVDGRLAYEDTSMVWTHHPYMSCNSVWFVFMHGGLKASRSSLDFEVGRVRIADSYMGVR